MNCLFPPGDENDLGYPIGMADRSSQNIRSNGIWTFYRTVIQYVVPNKLIHIKNRKLNIVFNNYNQYLKICYRKSVCKIDT